MKKISISNFAIITFAILAGCNPGTVPPTATETPPPTAVLTATETAIPATPTPDATATPTPHKALPIVPAPLAAGGYHTCRITDAGAIHCWGNNRYGQLGNGTTGQTALPVKVEEISTNAVAVAAGKNHTCALDRDGAVLCWGANDNGQLGDGSTIGRSLPAPVAGLDAKTVMIAAGDSFTCALSEDGGVKCWGWNGEGQLGDGTQFDSVLPLAVQGLDAGIVSIAAGKEHVCALSASGGVKCWGRGTEGQLGDGRRLSSGSPVEAAGLTSGVTRLAAGGTYSCAIWQTEKAVCWGINTPEGGKYDSPVPIEIGEIRGRPSSVGIGEMFACAVVAEGGIQCWGRNRVGQLGNGLGIDSPDHPVEVEGLPSGAAYLAVGYMHACAQSESGGIRCWGSNESWQLGEKYSSLAYSPIEPDLSKLHFYYSGIEASAPPPDYPLKYNSIWTLTGEFRDLTAPGINTYAVTVNRKSVWAWDFYQCAKGVSRLEVFLSGVKVTFLIDYQPVSENAVLIFRSSLDSRSCQGWTTSLSQWEKDQSELAIVYEYAGDLFDGENTYPAGKYWQIILLKAEDEPAE